MDLMKRAAWLCLLLALAPMMAWSDEAESSHRKAARELIDVERTWRDPTAVAEPVLKVLIRQSPEMETDQEVILDWLKKNLTWEQLSVGLVDAYVQTFTEAELRQLTAFFKSPVGQKSLKQGPALNKAEAMAALDILIDHHAELDAIVEAEKAKKPKKPAASPAETLAEANRLYDEARWSGAMDAYLKYLVSNPSDLNARTDLGVTLRQLGRYEEAVEQFNRVLAEDPEHFQALYNKIVVTGLDLGHKRDAEALLVNLRKLQPDSEEVKALAKALKEK
jgi:uncharacterized protein